MSTADPAAPAPRTKVLFIAGHGRSGSTLLDRTLGQTPHLCSAGELRHIWHRGFGANQLCGCEQPFRACPFWTEVTERAYGPGGPDVERTLALKARVDRWWRSLEIAAPRRPAGFQADLDQLVGTLAPLYHAIRQTSGDRVVVDSTKDVSYGFVLTASDELDVHVVHLVRDSRASAYSWRRRKYDPGKSRELDRYGLIKASAAWNASHGLASLLRHTASGYQLVRYSEFASDPATTVQRILAGIGEDGPCPVAPDGSVELGVDHTVAGNPVRFQRGRIEIRADEEWRAGLPRPARALVTTLTAPVLLATRDPRVGHRGGAGPG